jgi:hypothetical protein
MSSKIAVWAQDTTPQDNHQQTVAAFVAVAGSYIHHILHVVVEVVERKQEQELAPGTVVAVDTVVAAAADTLEEWEPRPVHHTPQKDLLVVGRGIVAAAASVVVGPTTDRRQVVVQDYQLVPVVPRDRPRWDSRQEPTLRRQSLLQTDRPWRQLHMLPAARKPSHPRHFHDYCSLKDQSRASNSNADLSWLHKINQISTK